MKLTPRGEFLAVVLLGVVLTLFLLVCYSIGETP